MLELGDDSEAEHRAVGEYVASRADAVVTVGEAARPIADGAGERAALADNDVAVDWLRGHLAADDVVHVKASLGRASTRSPPRSRSLAARARRSASPCRCTDDLFRHASSLPVMRLDISQGQGNLHVSICAVYVDVT